ncbi:MAG TPA: hypothetical protein PLM98_14740 [Thiolinea sp.]|nr:hypothetical protein [Thiolinea sp.]
MKLYLLSLVACATLAACAPQAPKTPPTTIVIPASQPTMTPMPKSIPVAPAPSQGRATLNEIHVDTDLSMVGAPMDWIQIFSAISFSNASSSQNLGFSHRVASFSSAAALKADSLERLKLVAEVPAGKKGALADEMVHRATSQIDFNTNDLIAVYLTDGGPPFGEYRYSMVGDTMEFCVDKAPNPSGISGMALKTIVKFYAAPKGLKVKMCGH